jgi:hypothetical protein
MINVPRFPLSTHDYGLMSISSLTMSKKFLLHYITKLLRFQQTVFNNYFSLQSSQCGQPAQSPFRLRIIIAAITAAITVNIPTVNKTEPIIYPSNISEPINRTTSATM